MRSQLRDDQTLIENIGDGKEYIEVGGGRKHVMSYLGDFLFSADRARGPISALSGGERNRLLLARLFSRPSNVLVLDEPTNDLDIETLDLLEELLADYAGTVLCVSHDRDFLDRICSSLLVLESPGYVREFIGGYEDYAQIRVNELAKIAQLEKAAAKNPAPISSNESAKAEKRKLSFKEQRELDALPALIESLEADIANIHAELIEPEVYANHTKLLEVQAKLNQQEQALEKAFVRWELLS
jgi:ATP-binding cassette subfamily F protein uup